MNDFPTRPPVVGLAVIFLVEVILLLLPGFFPGNSGAGAAWNKLLAPFGVIVYLGVPIAVTIFAGRILAAQGNASKGFSYFLGAMFSIIGIVVAGVILLNMKGG